jgi:hypothetical protein
MTVVFFIWTLSFTNIPDIMSSPRLARIPVVLFSSAFQLTKISMFSTLAGLVFFTVYGVRKCLILRRGVLSDIRPIAVRRETGFQTTYDA